MGKDLNSLTNSELLAELKASGLPVFPVTQTSRNYVIKKLQECTGAVVEQEIDDLCTSISNVSINEESKSTKAELYYVVDSPNCQKVYRNLHEAVNVIKSSPGSRFYSFTSYEEADSVCRSVLSTGTGNFDVTFNTSYYSAFSTSVNSPLTSLVAWKTPSLKMILKFRLNIERGNIRKVVSMCTENPRYFVTSSDCPVILHEGLRRNAFHVIACHNQAKILKFMIRIMRSSLWQRVALLPEIREAQLDEARLDNIDVDVCATKILDYYFNTPDKILRETPLHLALKYGHVDVAETLLNERMVGLFPLNKVNKSPYEIICSCYRGEDAPEIKERLVKAFRTALNNFSDTKNSLSTF